MYTQYKPSPSNHLLAPIATISTSSSSSGIADMQAPTKSRYQTLPHSTNGHQTNGVTTNQQASPALNQFVVSANIKSYFGANRRECIFYHSTDNNALKMSYAQRQQQYIYDYQNSMLKEQKKKFVQKQQEIDTEDAKQQQEVVAVDDKKVADDQRVLSKNSCIYSYELINRPARSDESSTSVESNNKRVTESPSSTRGTPADVKPVIMHSAPFNSTSQVQSVSDLFKEDQDKLNYNLMVRMSGNRISTHNNNRFDRTDINQMSTKSQPPLSNDFMTYYTGGGATPSVNATRVIHSATSSNSSNSASINTVTSSSSSASSSSSTTPIENKTNHHQFNVHKSISNVILPHPAQV